MGQTKQAEEFLNEAKVHTKSKNFLRIYNLLAICAFNRNDLDEYNFYLNQFIKLHKCQKPSSPTYIVTQNAIDLMNIRKKPTSQWDENDKNEILRLIPQFKPEDNALMNVGMHLSLAKYEIQQNNPTQAKKHLDYVLQYRKPSRLLIEAQELLELVMSKP